MSEAYASRASLRRTRFDRRLVGKDGRVRILRAIIVFIDPPRRDGSDPHALSDEERLDERLHEGHWWSESQNAYKARLPSADAPFKRGYRP